jgi:hypothetical protein
MSLSFHFYPPVVGFSGILFECTHLSPSPYQVTTVGSQDTTLQGHGDPMVQQRAVGATDEQEMSIYKKDVNRVRGVYAPRFVAERQQKLDEKARRKAEAGLILERALTVPLVPRDMQRASEKTLALEQEDPEAEAALSPVEREKLNYWRKIKKMRRLAVEAKETAVKEQRAIDRETAIKRKEEWNRRSYKLIRQAELHSTFWQTDMSQLVNSPAFWNNGAALHTDEEFFGKEKASQFSEQEVSHQRVASLVVCFSLFLSPHLPPCVYCKLTHAAFSSPFFCLSFALSTIPHLLTSSCFPSFCLLPPGLLHFYTHLILLSSPSTSAHAGHPEYHGINPILKTQVSPLLSLSLSTVHHTAMINTKEGKEGRQGREARKEGKE